MDEQYPVEASNTRTRPGGYTTFASRASQANGAGRTKRLRIFKAKRIWKAIESAYPQDHRARKNDLCAAIAQTKRSEAPVILEEELRQLQRDRTDNDQLHNTTALIQRTRNLIVQLNQQLGHYANLTRALRNLRGDPNVLREDIAFWIDHEEDVRGRLQTHVDAAVPLLEVFTRRAENTDPDRQGQENRVKGREQWQRNVYDKGAGNSFFSFGGGNSGTALGVWVVSDAFGNITDRAVIKDVHFDPDWNSSILWRNPRDLVNKVPMEVVIMERLNEAERESQTRSPKIVNLRNWAMHVDKLMFRVSSIVPAELKKNKFSFSRLTVR